MEFFKKPIYKSRKNKKIDGVCAGIANSLEVDASWIRILFALTILLGGSGIIVYLILDIALEKEPE
ncbi:PspC domain-containing protein [Clostridium senegalense]|uniref:PspC domain-containing protein n=1 Tax=Clostridium senegalense TaxID=1465809 RepID=A0A6M0GYI3_9CLOT|nr:PspC domain-containing protein [Clostridium senegalense]NEU03399.1 PspC domain-containing protein [Clostridium senegalense]